MKFKDATGSYKCDFCEEVFDASKIKLSKPAENFKFITPIRKFVYIDKDGIATCGSEQPTVEKGDQILTCPKCDSHHIFGMDQVKELA
jgi:hypothetical protein